MYKNIEKQTSLKLKDLVSYQDGQVVSKTLVQNELVSMTMFSFEQGEEISTHAAGGDAQEYSPYRVWRNPVQGAAYGILLSLEGQFHERTA